MNQPNAASPGVSIAQRLLVALANSDSRAAFIQRALDAIREWASASAARLYHAQGGTWRAIGHSGLNTDAPSAALSEAADRDARFAKDGWEIIPLGRTHARGHLLALYSAGSAIETAEISQLQTAVAAALGIAQQREQTQFASQLQKLMGSLPSDTVVAYRELERAAAQLFQAECALITVCDNNSGTLRRPHAAKDQTEEFALPEIALPNRKEPCRFVADATNINELTATSGRVGVTIRSLFTRSLADGSRPEEVLVLVNPLNASPRELIERTGQFAEAIARHALAKLDTTSHPIATSLIGDSPPMRQLASQIERVAPTDLVVLIVGENGTGKELVSRILHERSTRKDQPLLAVNCGALTETLLESELFGHEKGAFTDAHESKPGKFEQANGGTLFLDEIGELSLAAQSKLLRALEERTIVRVGGSQPIQTDARIIAATNRDLPAMVREEQFRQDLFYRLNVVILPVPALRARGDDVITIAESLLTEFARKAGRTQPPQLSPDAKMALRSWSWPGNVRELRNLIERLAYLTTSDKIDADALRAEFNVGTTLPPIQSRKLTKATHEFQIQHIDQTIQSCGGSITEAAKALGLHRSNLYRKMRQLGMSDRDDEQSP